MASSTERPRALEDEIDFTVPYDPGLAPPSRHILVFFVAGNPGLIEYYRNYLADLATLLARRTRQDGVPAKDVRYHVHGASLAGFDLSPKSRRRLSSRPKHAPPFSLDEIKQDLIGRVQDKARSIADAYRVDKRQISVILIGHSVGAWLLLETVAWYQDARSRSSKEDSLEHLPLPDVRIVGGILLFPTVIELSRSPSGLVSAVGGLPGPKVDRPLTEGTVVSAMAGHGVRYLRLRQDHVFSRPHLSSCLFPTAAPAHATPTRASDCVISPEQPRSATSTVRETLGEP